MIALCTVLLSATSFAEQSVTLAWNPNSSANAVGYRFYSLEEGALAAVMKDVGANTQTTVTNLKDGLRYYFTVTAYNSFGIESIPSDVVTFDAPVSLRIIPPSTPGGLVRIQFPIAPGRSYDLQASTNLRSWTTIWQTGGAISYQWVEFQDLQSGTLGMRLYRLQLP